MNSKAYIALISLAFVLFIAVYFYKRGKEKGRMAEFPNNGSGIPQGWSPAPVVERLISAMQGFGTNESEIWASLTGLTQDQLAAVYNEFNKQLPEGQTLFEWFRNDLSGDDLARALAYFSFIKT